MSPVGPVDAARSRSRPMMLLVRSIDRDAVLPRVGRPGLLSPNALLTLVAYSLFANGDGDECWVGDRVLADAVVCSRSTITRGKAELLRLGLVQLVPAGESARASKAGAHHRVLVARLSRAGIEALPRIASPSFTYRVTPAGVLRQEGGAPPYVDGDLKKKWRAEEEPDHSSEMDLGPAWTVAEAVAQELERPAPSRGERSERSLRKLLAEAVAASAEHWQAALRARLTAFYEQTDPWLDRNRWPLGSALRIAQPQMHVQTYAGEVVGGKRGRARIVRIGREIVAREFVEDVQEPPASGEYAEACVSRIQSMLTSDGGADEVSEREIDRSCRIPRPLFPSRCLLSG